MKLSQVELPLSGVTEKVIRKQLGWNLPAFTRLTWTRRAACFVMNFPSSTPVWRKFCYLLDEFRQIKLRLARRIRLQLNQHRRASRRLKRKKLVCSLAALNKKLRLSEASTLSICDNALTSSERKKDASISLELWQRFNHPQRATCHDVRRLSEVEDGAKQTLRPSRDTDVSEKRFRHDISTLPSSLSSFFPPPGSIESLNIEDVFGVCVA